MMVTLSCVLGLSLVLSATAADQQTTKPKASAQSAAHKPVKRYPYHAHVAAVDASAKTITLDSKTKQRVLYVTPTTKILKDKKPVALETINAGDYVTGSLVDTDGRLEPTTVNVGGVGSKKTTLSVTPSKGAADEQKDPVGKTKGNPTAKKF